MHHHDDHHGDCCDHDDAGVMCQGCVCDVLSLRRKAGFYGAKFQRESAETSAPALPHRNAWDESRFSITFPFAASHGRDRVGDFLEVAGIVTDKHRGNPVAFLDHGRNPDSYRPIGVCEDPLTKEYTVTIDEEHGIASCTVFLAMDVPDYLIPLQCFHLFKQGVLRAGSIGYRVLKAKRLPPDPELGLFKPGLHLLEVELLEPSLVGLPVNGDAVRKAWEGVAGKPLAPCFKSMLAPWLPARTTWPTRVHRPIRRRVTA